MREYHLYILSSEPDEYGQPGGPEPAGTIQAAVYVNDRQNTDNPILFRSILCGPDLDEGNHGPAPDPDGHGPEEGPAGASGPHDAVVADGLGEWVVSVVIKGMDKLMATLSRIEQGAGLRQGIGKACRLVEASAVDRCPVDTGELQQSIHSETPGPADEPVGIVGTNKEYGPYVEMGTGLFAVNGDGRTDVPWRYQDAKGDWHTTSGQKPQPFLGPALRDNMDQVAELIAEGVRKDVKG